MSGYFNKMHRGVAIAAAMAVGCFGDLAIAQDAEGSGAVRRSVLEEVIVTAQRSSESIQDVPIAVTALTGEMLEDRQVINPSDLQLNAPNVSFTATNFGNSSFSIRGIGRLVISTSGESGVSTHINEIPITSNLNAVEFFDVERVELLRGPQGTLFGRNATGGTINMVTKMPDFENLGGFVDVEAGDYAHLRLKGAINIPITDSFAVRIAGMSLQRDGYIKNLASGQENVNVPGEFLPGIDDDIDGRGYYAGRMTALWEPADNVRIWAQYNKFKEDDDKARITNQVCKTTALPTTGCEADEFAFERPHLATSFFEIVGALNGALPLGLRGDEPNVSYDYPRPANIGFRAIHTDFEPIFQQEEDNYLFGFDLDAGSYNFGLLAAYQETIYHSRQDYAMDVGPQLSSLGINRLYPTSNPPVGPNAERDPGSPCNYNAGNAGVASGTDDCTLDVDQTRSFAFDQVDTVTEYWTVEAKFASAYEGAFNFVVGVSTYAGETAGDYYVVANTADIANIHGVPPSGVRLYPSYFNSATNKLKTDGTALFSELYFDVSDNIKVTAGLRYNIDNKEIFDSTVLATSVFVSAVNRYVRASVAPLLNPTVELTAGQSALLALYSTPAEIAASRAGAVLAVPLVPAPNEQRRLTNSPTENEWKEYSGRIGVDWRLNSHSLLYGFFSKGYKPGGFNPAIPEAFQGSSKFVFDAEGVNAVEIGSKNDLLNGSLVFNVAAFIYDYTGLQVTRIVNNSSINDNIDAQIYGLELEAIWQPEAAPGLAIDATYSYLHSAVDGSSSIDPINRTASNPDWIILQSLDLLTVGANYIARESVITTEVIDALAGLGAVLQVPGAIYPINSAGAAIPVYMARAGLAGVLAAGARGAGRSEAEADAFVANSISDGLPTDLDGNTLPNSPEHTIHLGVTYTWQIEAIGGDLGLRWDYYWQGESYAREFNTKGDEIGAWDQHNLSLNYESHGGHFQARLWIRNLMDEENVTGKYLASDTSGFFRNYFLTEPRIFGASIRYSFGL